MSKTAILVDGAYFLKMYRSVYTREEMTPEIVTRNLYTMCLRHLEEGNSQRNGDQRNYAKTHDLYRIFFYDCPPLNKKAHFPISKKPIDFALTETATFRNALHACLKEQRKVALRMGHLANLSHWTIKADVLKSLLAQKKRFDELVDNDFVYDTKQKTVDMKIGLDVASLSYKRLVDQIILISGDSDFIPAAKLARREGIDFILDPMHKAIPAELSEHIDGKRSTCPRPTIIKSIKPI